MAKKLTKEIVEKVLLLDCRKRKDKERLVKSILKLPFIKGEKDLTVDRLEEIINNISKKHDITLGYIMRSGRYNSGMIKKKDKGDWIKSVHGINIWEVLAKTIFFMYYYIKYEKGRGNEES